MMIHNLVKYLVQTQFRLWYIKITNFKPESCLDDLLEICYFYISQKSRVWTRYFTRLYIIYMCDFFCEFRRLFCRGLHGFSRSCDFHKIHSHFKMVPLKFDMEFRPEARFCSLLYNCMSLLYAPRGKRVPQLERCKWPNINSNNCHGFERFNSTR